MAQGQGAFGRHHGTLDCQARRTAPGIHDYWWNTPEELAANKPYGRQLIEPGVPGKETFLVVFLRKGIGSIPKMPRGGPFLKEEEVQEIERWIDDGMPVE